MKRFSKIIPFAVLGVIVTVVVVSCCNFPFPLINGTTACFAPGKCSVEIGPQPRSKSDEAYVNWKSQQKFDEALNQVCANGGTYCIQAKLDNGKVIYPYHPEGSKDCTYCVRKDIRTVKVMKSKAADSLAAGESVANDPNVMHKVQSPNPGDIVAVVNALKQ
jgi:hypothetical protein